MTKTTESKAVGFEATESKAVGIEATESKAVGFEAEFGLQIVPPINASTLHSA